MITDVGLINILSNLQWCSKLKEIHLGNNANLTEIALNALIDTLPVFKNLRILGMNNCGLIDENIINLAYILQVSFSKITIISFIFKISLIKKPRI